VFTDWNAARIGRLSFQEVHMPDDLSKKGPADRSRISLTEPHEVQYWADRFNVSKERLSEAVRKVGHSAEAVGRELAHNKSL
jgi:uncharacterized protein DUF3606